MPRLEYKKTYEVAIVGGLRKGFSKDFLNAARRNQNSFNELQFY